MAWACSRVEKYVGYDLHIINATHLKVIAQKCDIAGFINNFISKENPIFFFVL